MLTISFISCRLSLWYIAMNNEHIITVWKNNFKRCSTSCSFTNRKIFKIEIQLIYMITKALSKKHPLKTLRSFTAPFDSASDVTTWYVLKSFVACGTQILTKFPDATHSANTFVHRSRKYFFFLKNFNTLHTQLQTAFFTILINSS